MLYCAINKILTKHCRYSTLLFLFTLLPAHWLVAQTDFHRSAAVDQAIQAEMKRQNVVGAAVAVISNSKVVYQKGYGFANLRDRTPVTVDSVFNWASNSKPVMAILALQLVQDGKLDLDAPIRNYLPEIGDQFAEISTRHLLCHQSGIPHYSNGRIVASGKRAKPEAELDPRESLKRFGKSELLFEPGAKTSYSSYAYVLLSAVVQAAGKQEIASQLSERITGRLKMDSFQLDVPFDGQPNWVTGYRMLLGIVAPVPDYSHAWKHGAGGYKSNIGDFSKFALALSNQSLIDADTTKKMWTNQTESGGEKSEYGLGVAVSGQNDTLKVTHNGSQDETRTRMVIYPNRKRGVVFMSNTTGIDPVRFTTAVYSALED
ncbi:MAG: serine hydrolase domain-containing protein [Planctomycetota bacterium]